MMLWTDRRGTWPRNMALTALIRRPDEGGVHGLGLCRSVRNDGRDGAGAFVTRRRGGTERWLRRASAAARSRSGRDFEGYHDDLHIRLRLSAKSGSPVWSRSWLRPRSPRGAVPSADVAALQPRAASGRRRQPAGPAAAHGHGYRDPEVVPNNEKARMKLTTTSSRRAGHRQGKRHGTVVPLEVDVGDPGRSGQAQSDRGWWTLDRRCVHPPFEEFASATTACVTKNYPSARTILGDTSKGAIADLGAAQETVDEILDGGA